MPRSIESILPGYANPHGLALYRALYRDQAGRLLAGEIAAVSTEEAARLAQRTAGDYGLTFDRIEDWPDVGYIVRSVEA